ncbi:MAG: cryptochrome/photolyase family protein [Wenzhouxiangellaceae bacterium]|nr:cryptochrome/photolyase family protein [Wenzhouxiangellaceae bacterium]
MPRLALVTGDQLSPALASLRAITPGRDHVLMAELADEAGYVPHHVKKIALIFSAMRHFAGELEQAGQRVYYHSFDPDSRIRSFSDAIEMHCREHDIDEIVLTRPGEWRVFDEFGRLEKRLGVPVHVLEDERFVSTPDEFAEWAGDRAQLRMEFFYRRMRRKTGLLMSEDGEAEGGQWNFDADNRRKWKGEPKSARPMSFAPDATTQAVLDLVDRRIDSFGRLDGFDFAVTRAQARRALRHFVKTALPWFGDYQDALPDDEDFLFHSRLSAYLNIGLLDPLEVCRAVEAAWRAGDVPLNAAEGYIRQIIGWREFVRGIYWLKMPEYADENFLGGDQDLPEWYWSGETGMRCLQRAIENTRNNAYAHHIQRLMVTGNFGLLLGVRPKELCDWYLAVYADAFEWVELPNTLGMVLFGDGGLLASKPYAASGKYIQRMGDHCANCRYAVTERTGHDACPFNALYWDFLMRNEDSLGGNPRMRMMYRNVERLAPADKAAITRRANWIRENVEAL